MRIFSYVLAIGVVCSVLYLGLGRIKPERDVCVELPGYRGNMKLHMTVPRRAKVWVEEDRIIQSNLKVRDGEMIGCVTVPVDGRQLSLDIFVNKNPARYTIEKWARKQRKELKAAKTYAPQPRVKGNYRLIKTIDGKFSDGSAFHWEFMYIMAKADPFIYRVSYMHNKEYEFPPPPPDRPVDRAVARKILESCYLE